MSIALIGCNIYVGGDAPKKSPAADTEVAPTAAPEEPEVAEPEKEEAAQEEPVNLREILMEGAGVSDKETIYFHEEDFDGDGTDEAFAITGKLVEGPADDETVEGTAWFVSKDGCTDLRDTEGFGIAPEPEYMTLGNTKYVMFTEEYTTGWMSFVWSVENGDAVEAPISRVGKVSTDPAEGEGRFQILDSSYDFVYDPEVGDRLGHTWKVYYFFYDPESDEIKEYGGTAISADDVEKLCGRDLVGELVPKDAKVDSVFCRGNGLVAINYEQPGEDDCIYYYHYIYDFVNGRFIDDFAEETTDEEPLAGTYKEALIEDMADYCTPPLSE